MLGKRVEAQIRWDWDLSPGLHSLDFASKVNTSLGIGYRKGMQKLEDANQTPDDSRIGLAMKKLYDLLQTGEYLDDHNVRRPIKGDVTKLQKVIGLTPLHQHVLRSVFFMSSKLAGVRQTRTMIGHVLTGGRVVFGIPAFMTITPSERHSGLLIRLSRYRESDPALNIARPEFLPYAGYTQPSVYLPNEVEHAEIDIPDYDL